MTIAWDFKRIIQPYYDDYIKKMSDMAPSMKTLALLLSLCVPGSSVLDLGTGFSSFMLRYFAPKLGISVWSVDDDRKWLEKTKAYCKANNCPTIKMGLFYEWNEFLDGWYPGFDLVFMDLGTTKRRPAYYGTVLSRLCRPRTMVLLDDLHKPVLKNAIEEELKNYEYLNIGVEEQTKDEYGRYCKLIYMLRPKKESITNG